MTFSQRWPKLFMRVKFIVENTVMNYTCMRMCLEIVLKHFMILYSKSLYCLYFVVAITDISIGLLYVEYLVSICSLGLLKGHCQVTPVDLGFSVSLDSWK